MKFFKIVKPRTTAIIERFGKYNRTLTSGPHFYIPYIEKVAHTVSLKETAIIITQQEVITKDSVEMKIDGALYCQIIDPYTASYECENAFNFVEKMAKSVLRSEIGQTTLDDTLHERKKLNKRLLEDIKSAADRWGIEVKRYEIKTIMIDDLFLGLMSRENQSERYRSEKQIEAESIRIETINNAERERMKIINESMAQGKSDYLELKGLANKVEAIKSKLDNNEVDSSYLSFKLKNDLVDSFEGLANSDKKLFLKKDLSDFEQLFESLNKKFDGKENK